MTLEESWFLTSAGGPSKGWRQASQTKYNRGNRNKDTNFLLRDLRFDS